MSPVNKYEAIGIFLSVAVMAVALTMIRFQTNIGNSVAMVDGESQSALVVVDHKNGGDITAERTKALIDASSIKELTKLVIDDVRVGTGSQVKEGDTLTVDYTGKTIDGVKFDSSRDSGEPYTFTIGEHKVIQGWEKGLIGMRVGGQRILVIPPSLAYGNRQVGPIPANTPLVFEVELLEIK